MYERKLQRRKQVRRPITFKGYMVKGHGLETPNGGEMQHQLAARLKREYGKRLTPNYAR